MTAVVGIAGSLRQANAALLRLADERMPGDCAMRPPNDQARVFRGKPVAIIGATPGGMGTALAQAAWLPVMRSLGMRWYSGGLLYVSRAGSAFDAAGELQDPALGERLAQYLKGFVDFVNEH